ncbi:PadR family transcriptional regulator [Anaerocolumna sp.]|uniref:PadR family transcriptional regulator n=1 Tax=Anaerocolumna sp. TaxID=2041569 RepID=UPI0028B18116|nr:PadR family transcriptional regulator [Anaerocolumna sp.]
MRDTVKGGALTEATLYILLSVYSPNHGYGIMQFIEKETEGRLVLGAGTLYGAINNLLKKKCIEPVNEDNTERKKEYVITELGCEMVESEIDRLSKLLLSAKNIVGGNKP